MITINQFIAIFYWAFWLAGLLTLTLILIYSVRRYRAASRRKGVVVAKAAGAVLVWLILSFGILFVDAMFAFASSHTINGPDLDRLLNLEEAVLYVIGLNVVWVIAGLGLVYWVSRRRKAQTAEIDHAAI